MLAWRSSALLMPLLCSTCWPYAICTPDTSTPIARSLGWRTATAMRLPPAEQPSSSTRAVLAAGASTPKMWAMACSRSGADWGKGRDWYGVWSYVLRMLSVCLVMRNFSVFKSASHALGACVFFAFWCVLVRLASCYTQFAAGNQGGGFGDKKNRAKIILTVFKARLPKNYYPHKHRRQPNIWR